MLHLEVNEGSALIREVHTPQNFSFYEVLQVVCSLTTADKRRSQIIPLMSFTGNRQTSRLLELQFAFLGVGSYFFFFKMATFLKKFVLLDNYKQIISTRYHPIPSIYPTYIASQRLIHMRWRFYIAPNVNMVYGKHG